MGTREREDIHILSERKEDCEVVDTNVMGQSTLTLHRSYQTVQTQMLLNIYLTSLTSMLLSLQHYRFCE